MKKIIENQISYYERLITEIRKDISFEHIMEAERDAGYVVIKTLEKVCADLKRCIKEHDKGENK